MHTTCNVGLYSYTCSRYYMLYDMYSYNIVYLSIHLSTSLVIVPSDLDAKIHENKLFFGGSGGEIIYLSSHISGSPRCL